MGSRVAIGVTAVAVLGIAAVTAWAVGTLGFFTSGGPDQRLPLATAACWALFAVGILALRRVPRRAVAALVLTGSVLIGGAAMAGPPNTSTDSARYAWDGIVQTHGVSPYAHAPTSPRLAEYRPEWLFPEPIERSDGTFGCRGDRIQTSHEPGSDVVVCTALNRGAYRTIYPPAAELVFAAVRLVVGPDAEYWPLQLLGLVLSVGITVLLLRALPRRGLDPRWAALWAWCPLVASEAVTNSHIDVLGALLLLVATLPPAGASGWRAGFALGTGMSAKLTPALALPALLGRRGWWKVALGAIGVFALLYVPYILVSGVKVLGYLPHYLTEEGYSDGSRFALLGWIHPRIGATVVAAIVILVTAVLVWRKSDPDRPWLGATVMIGVTLLVASPRYPWYALLMVPMIAMTGRWEWLAVALALSIRQLEPHTATFRVALVAAIVVVVLASAHRAGRGGLRRAGLELRHPLRRPRATSPTVDA